MLFKRRSKPEVQVIKTPKQQGPEDLAVVEALKQLVEQKEGTGVVEVQPPKGEAKGAGEQKPTEVQPPKGEVKGAVEHEPAESQPLDLTKFRRELTMQQMKLIKSIATRNYGYILLPGQAGYIKGEVPSDEEIKGFIGLCQRSPHGVANMENEMLDRISRERDKYPDSWAWEGRRARYRIERAQLNQTVNEMFGTKLPVVEHELSKNRLMEHATRKGQEQ